tara:strand:+ start:354 stop:1343 length:990 start_codon:yes stop_codon:yes gene_type:complete
MSKLNQMIHEFREEIGQSIEGLALLMRMEPDDYAELEKEWIPPDDILKRLCSLFEWNYKEIKKIADNSHSTDQRKNNKEPVSNFLKDEDFIDKELPLFSKMVIQAKKEVNQDEIGIATLLGIPVEYFKEIEDGLLPPNELTRKICTLFGWNFKEIKQKINAQSKIIFHSNQQNIDPKKNKIKLSDNESHSIKKFKPPAPLNEILLKARKDAKQNIEGISILLQISPELYEKIESGSIIPEPDLLKRISSLFGWNYHDMLKREKSSNYGHLLPIVTKLDLKESSFSEIKLRKIQNEIEEKWRNISRDQQETMLKQLDFLLGSMEKLNKDD